MPVLRGTKQSVIVVDGADFQLDRERVALKAAVQIGGRAISLHERIFPFEQYNSPSAHAELVGNCALSYRKTATRL